MPLLYQLVVWSRTSREVTALPRKRVAIESSFPQCYREFPLSLKFVSKWKNLPSQLVNYQQIRLDRSIWLSRMRLVDFRELIFKKARVKQILHLVNSLLCTSKNGNHFWSKYITIFPPIKPPLFYKGKWTVSAKYNFML